jgi:hypothetical protein
VETVTNSGEVIDYEHFSVFQDAWAYSMFDTHKRGWRFNSRSAAQQHFDYPAGDQFITAWRPGIVVRIRRVSVAG